MPSRPIVVKLGGELLEQPDDLSRVARGIARLASRIPLVVVHGGGREIDAAMSAKGLSKVQVDGIRVTDEATLTVVVAVLAGAINTRLVAAIRRAGGRPVGLTGADADVVTARKAAPMKTRSDQRVDLGLVGEPVPGKQPKLVATLLAKSYVPVVACIGATSTGRLLNVNADTLAAHLASELRAVRLVMLGATSGVLDEQGQTIPRLTVKDASRLIRSGTASRGMVAKLAACRSALQRGVGDVIVANGRTVTFALLADPARTVRGCTQVTT